MMAVEKKLVIIGGGIAGISAALAARMEYPAAQITILAAEDEPFYCRIALSSLVSGALPEEYLASFAPDFLPARRILYLSGTAALAIDKERHVVITKSEEFPYDSLILASGASPFVPPVPGLKEAAHLLWTMADARRLAQDLQAIKEAKIAIIGGGVLAIESALMLAKMGHQVTIFEVGPHLMPRQLNEKAAALLQKMVTARGITVSCAVQISAISQENGTYTLTLQDGSKIAAAIILAQAGVRPNTTLAREADIACKNGILVNEAMQTSDPAILACGNCVEFKGTLEQLWNPARRQGEVAGQNAFAVKSQYLSRPLELHLKSREIALYSSGNWAAAKSCLEEFQDNSYRALFFDNDGKLIAAILLGNIAEYPKISAAISSQNPALPESYRADFKSAFKAITATDEDGHTLDWDGQRWVCRQCGYSYEGLLPPAVCPVCHVGRDQFIPA